MDKLPPPPVLFHLPSEESWPAVPDHESVSQPAVQAKWRRRADLLRLHEPDFPVPPMSGSPDDGGGDLPGRLRP